MNWWCTVVRCVICRHMYASGTVNLSNYQSVSSRMACRNGVKTVDEEFLYIILKADQLGLCQNLPELTVSCEITADALRHIFQL